MSAFSDRSLKVYLSENLPKGRGEEGGGHGGVGRGIGMRGEEKQRLHRAEWDLAEQLFEWGLQGRLVHRTRRVDNGSGSVPRSRWF